MHNILISGKNDTIKITILLTLCDFYSNNNPTKALQFGVQGIQLSQENKYKKGIGSFYKMIGDIYNNQGNYDKAIEYYFSALRIYEETNNQLGIASCLFSIGSVYIGLNEYEKGLSYYFKSLKIREKFIDMLEISNCYIQIGYAYYRKKDNLKSMDYYSKSLKINKKYGYNQRLAECYNGIGNIFSSQDNNIQAMTYYLEASKIFEEIGNGNWLALVYGNIAGLYIQTKKYNDAIFFAKKSLNVAVAMKLYKERKSAYFYISKAYKNLGDYKKALDNYTLYKTIGDSMYEINYSRKVNIVEMNSKFEKIQKEKEFEQKRKDLIKEEELKRQKYFRNTFIFGFAIMIIFSILIFKSYRQKKKANGILKKLNQEISIQKIEIEEKNEELNMQNEEIRVQRDQVENQHKLLEEKNIEIIDSIHYALRIQTAVLPSEQYLRERIHGNFFVLYKPKDIVSGDFFFVESRNNWTFIAVADCTGHGVPGAFMSMLGISFLNEIIAKEIQSAGNVLDELRKYVIHSLQQKGITGEQKDGMDISFVVHNTLTNEIQFAGANNPIYIFQINNEELIEIKGDKMPVAIHDKMNNFTNQVLQLQKGDNIYLMSDGYQDQFGGPKGKKFLSKNLKQLLVENVTKSMLEQKEILNVAIENWKNINGIKYEQTDDITIFGIKII